MGYNAHTLNLFDECEALAEELARINPADELLFYSNADTKRTEGEKEEMTVLFIENFFPDGAPTNEKPEGIGCSQSRSTSSTMTKATFLVAFSFNSTQLEDSCAALDSRCWDSTQL